MRRIGLTAGCPAGIGPEVLARALAELDGADAGTEWVFFGPAALLEAGARVAHIPFGVAGDTALLGEDKRPVCVVSHQFETNFSASQPGRPTARDLRLQADALVALCEAAARGELSAVVTGPIRKRALMQVPGGPFPGQTELCHAFLAADADPPLMCFAGGPFLLGLATVHLPLREVCAALTGPRLQVALARLADAATRLRRASPHVVVLGVNPHAGEGGLLGHEEEEVVAPVLAQARATGLRVEGPVPADGFFASFHRMAEAERPDAVLAMFHDQGLAPYKLLTAGGGVNMTWGLRVPRLSPDHGTADAIAGAGVADAQSMRAALQLALHLTTPRAEVTS